MLEKCSHCGRNKGINYYYKEDGKDWHTVCKECKDALFKNQPPIRD